MKKILCLALTLLMIATSVIAMVTSASAASATSTPTWIADFSEQRKYEALGSGASNDDSIALTWHDYYAKFTCTKDNANWMYTQCADIDTAKAKYLKIRINNESEGTKFEFFGNTETEDVAQSFPIRLLLPVDKGAGWKEYIFKIEDVIATGKWEGIITRFRYDFTIEPLPLKDDAVSIDYWAFFETEDDAKKFEIEKWESENPALPYHRVYEGDVNKYPTYILDYQTANVEAIKASCAWTALATPTYSNNALNWTFNNPADAGFANTVYTMPKPMSSSMMRYAVISFKNETSIPGFRIGISHMEAKANKWRQWYDITVSTKDSGYKKYVVDLWQCNPNGYKTELMQISGIRFEPCHGKTADEPASGEKCSIEYVAFFPTKAQAEAFDILKHRVGAPQTALKGDAELAAAPTTQRQPLANADPTQTTAATTKATTTKATTKAATTKAATTADVTTVADVAETTEAAKSGCGSSLGFGSALMVMSIGAVTVISKKRRK